MTKEKIIEKIIDEIKIDSKDFAMCYDIVEFSIDRVFTELEALQQRSCEGCKYGEIDKFEQYRVTCRNKLALFNQMINADFCCNRYEAKEQ